MNKDLTKKLLDVLVITILVAGAVLILTSIHFFFFQRYPSSTYTAPFMHRLSILALTIFAIAIATFLPVILLSFYKQKMDK